MDKSQVYFTTFKATLNENLLQKLHRLMKTAGFEILIFMKNMRLLRFTSENMVILHS